jgi:hypothetical protein
MCACGKATAMTTMTTTEMNALIEESRRQALNETEAMIASAAQAAQNANSGATAQR